MPEGSLTLQTGHRIYRRRTCATQSNFKCHWALIFPVRKHMPVGASTSIAHAGLATTQTRLCWTDPTGCHITGNSFNPKRCALFGSHWPNIRDHHNTVSISGASIFTTRVVRPHTTLLLRSSTATTAKPPATSKISAHNLGIVSILELVQHVLTRGSIWV